jgi:hypothetical protein
MPPPREQNTSFSPPLFLHPTRAGVGGRPNQLACALRRFRRHHVVREAEVGSVHGGGAQLVRAVRVLRGRRDGHEHGLQGKDRRVRIMRGFLH